MNQYPDFEIHPFVADSVKFIDEMKSPRFIKSHLPFHLLPRQITQNIKNPKVKSQIHLVISGAFRFIFVLIFELSYDHIRISKTIIYCRSSLTP